MFRESLLETSAGSIAQRGWATLTSFGLETIGVCVLLVTPMIITQTIQPTDYSQLIAAPLAAPPRGLRDRRPTTGSGGNPAGLFAPGGIPIHIASGRDPGPRGGGDLPICEGCIPEGIPGGNGVPGGLPFDFGNSGVTPDVPKPPVQTETKKIILSHLDEGMLLSKIEPRYPPLAKATRTQGEVVMAAIVGRDGRIENLRVLRGHPMLVPAALDAVSQWRYRPYMLNGQAVEVDTTISVKFMLRQE